MSLTIYQIDAFANRPFEGNPAAVCPLETWLADELMQSIAAENNLSETAFFVPAGSGYHIRWFTPVQEVDLCGHATLAAAFVIFTILDDKQNNIFFSSRSGELIVARNEDLLEMDFPAQPPKQCAVPENIRNAFQISPVECLEAEDYVVVFEDEGSVYDAEPDMSSLSRLDLRGVAITAIGSNYDFVTRFFAPKYGINEDPVTGSAFTQLVPYWADKLGKSHLSAKQVSPRSGEVDCRYAGDRVKISGKAVKYMAGTIEIHA